MPRGRQRCNWFVKTVTSYNGRIVRTSSKGEACRSRKDTVKIARFANYDAALSSYQRKSLDLPVSKNVSSVEVLLCKGDADDPHLPWECFTHDGCRRKIWERDGNPHVVSWRYEAGVEIEEDDTQDDREGR